MFVKMDINQDIEKIGHEVVDKYNYVDFPSKGKDIGYCMYYVNGCFNLEMIKKNKKDASFSTTIYEVSIGDKCYKDDSELEVFEMFFNKAYKCIAMIENLKEK